MSQNAKICSRYGMFLPGVFIAVELCSQDLRILTPFNCDTRGDEIFDHIRFIPMDCNN